MVTMTQVREQINLIFFADAGKPAYEKSQMYLILHVPEATDERMYPKSFRLDPVDCNTIILTLKDLPFG